jgi:hypothetical protein
VCAFAGTTLVASQFADYSYVQVLTVRTATRATGSAHAYVLVAVGAAAIVAASQALGNRRWKLGRVLGILGLAVLIVSFGVDLPQGVDPGGVGERYAQATASLAGGFWEQVLSGATLAVCGPLMAQASSRRA